MFVFARAWRVRIPRVVHRVCMRPGGNIYICVYIYIYIYIYTYISLSTYIQVCMYMCLYDIYIYICMHIYIYIYGDIGRILVKDKSAYILLHFAFPSSYNRWHLARSLPVKMQFSHCKASTCIARSDLPFAFVAQREGLQRGAVASQCCKGN